MTGKLREERVEHVPVSTSVQSDASQLIWAGAAGIAGALLLAVYFGVPALFPRFAALIYGAGTPSRAHVVSVGRDYHRLITVGCWAQGTGALLCVVFFLALVHRAREGQSFVGRIALLGSGLLVATVIVEMVLSFAWASAATDHQQAVANTAYNLTTHFTNVFPVVPAPTVYLAVAVALRRGRPVLPRTFAVLAQALGVAFLVAGLAEAIVPGVSAAVAVLSGLQAVWILAGGCTVLRQGLRVHDQPVIAIATA